MRLSSLLSLFILLFTVISTAQATTPSKADLAAPFSRVLQQPAAINSIKPSPIPGLYEVVIGTDIFYSTEKGDYIIYGHLIDTKNANPVSLTEQTTNQIRKKILANVDENTMIIYEPKGQTKATLTVFIDIDCGYCRKLHHEVKDLNNAGIRVRYIAFPRTGVNSESFDKAVNVWCSSNPQQALNDAMDGKPTVTASADCKKAGVIKEHLTLVKLMGVNATPTSYLAGGEEISGYYPAPMLIKMILDR